MEHIHVIITWQGNHIIGEEMMLACKRKVEHGDHNGMGDVKKKPFLKAYMEEGKPKKLQVSGIITSISLSYHTHYKKVSWL
jgi:hypothetical protein